MTKQEFNLKADFKTKEVILEFKTFEIRLTTKCAKQLMFDISKAITEIKKITKLIQGKR